MKKLLTVIFCAAAFASSNAATVTWGADQDFNFVLHDSAGSLLRQGSLAQIGTFSLTDAQIIALSSPTPANISMLNAAFTPFGGANGFARIGDGGFDADGAFAKVSTQSIDANSALLNQQIYYWVLKSTDDTGSTPSNSLSTAFEQAIFYRNKTVDGDWSFPNDLSATTVDAGDFRGAGGTISSGSVLLAGSYIVNSAAGALYNGGPTSAIQLAAVAAVPEPSAFAFGALAAFGVICSRHRRRQI